MKNARITVRLRDFDVERLDYLIKQGYAKTYGDAIRHAVIVYHSIKTNTPEPQHNRRSTDRIRKLYPGVNVYA
jgi:Arc/MetJ-type ribon-helix-helix transcriptional regulator